MEKKKDKKSVSLNGEVGTSAFLGVAFLKEVGREEVNLRTKKNLSQKAQICVKVELHLENFRKCGTNLFHEIFGLFERNFITCVDNLV